MKYKNPGILLIQAVMAVLLMIILSAVVLVAGTSYITAGKRGTASADTSTLGGCIHQYQMEVGVYPDTLSDLTKANGQYGPWLREVPADPFSSKNEYKYLKSEKGFIVYSVGVDGAGSSSIDAGIGGDDIGFVDF